MVYSTSLPSFSEPFPFSNTNHFWISQVGCFSIELISATCCGKKDQPLKKLVSKHHECYCYIISLLVQVNCNSAHFFQENKKKNKVYLIAPTQNKNCCQLIRIVENNLK